MEVCGGCVADGEGFATMRSDHSADCAVFAHIDKVWGAVPVEISSPTQVINETVGGIGRMIAGMKIAPKGHICVWNANIIVDGKKVWYGDLDLTKDAKKLQTCADTIGKPLYILREMDARFDTANAPKLDRAVAVIQPKAA